MLPTSMFEQFGSGVQWLRGRARWLQTGIRGFLGRRRHLQNERCDEALEREAEIEGVDCPMATPVIVPRRTSAMDFAPYQDTAPENTRALSPPPRRSLSRSPNPKSPPPNASATDPFSSSNLPAPSHFSDDPRGGRGANATGFGNTDLESGGGLNVNLFETSLPLRLDYEACLAYLLLPPAGGVFLLVMEHKSDYVRYVATTAK
ncbi:MAG: hypothetical protein Q9167_004864 [Letrouitia subvulpina]